MFGWPWTQVTSQPRVCCPERAGQWAFQERVQPVRASRGRWPHALRLHTAVTQNSSHFTPRHWPGGGAGPAGVSAPWDVKGKATGDVSCRPGRFGELRTVSPRVWSLGACRRQRRRVRRSPPVTSAVLCWPGLSHTCLFKGTMCKTISHSASGRGPERQGRQPRDTRRPERPGPGAPTPLEAPAWLVAGRLAV